MKVTVCELNDKPEIFKKDWDRLANHVATNGSNLVLLPEIPFCQWFGAAQKFDSVVWREALEVHDRWMERLNDLAPATVLGTRPVEKAGRRLNEGFVWDSKSGYRASHHKFYLPNEDGVWEGNWGHQGDGRFEPTETQYGRIGYMICSELWFFEKARAYAKAGVQLILVPRKTEKKTLEKWLIGGRNASIVSGAFCLSSNSVTYKGDKNDFGGQGWITDPDGKVMGVTDEKSPFLTLDIDLAVADRAKKTYPRNILEEMNTAVDK